MSTPAPKRDTHRPVAYGSEAYEQAVAAIPEALREGGGTCFLFVGASEEQKEEALSVIGEYDDLNMHQFQVSRLISERMVETQGNLREAFDNAGEDAALLLFDEADALFGERSEAEDAHEHRDRAGAAEETEEAKEEEEKQQRSDNEDAALSDYFFDRLDAYPGVAVICFSSAQHVQRLETYEAGVIVEF